MSRASARVFEQGPLDRSVPTDRIVCATREQHELPVGKRAPILKAVGAHERILAHQFQGGCRLHDALEPGVVCQRADEAQQIELTLPHQREGGRDAARLEHRVGICEEQEFGIFSAARPCNARVYGMRLARPAIRARVDLDDLEARVACDPCLDEPRRVVGTAIQRKHNPQLRVGLRPQRADEPLDYSRLIMGGHHGAHPACRRVSGGKTLAKA